MFPFLYLQVKYKEVIGQGTPIPDLPEVKRQADTEAHQLGNGPPRAGPFLHHPLPPPTRLDFSLPCDGQCNLQNQEKEILSSYNQGAEGTWLHV